MANYYDVQTIQMQIQKDNQEKSEKLKARIQQFDEVTSLEEAKELAKSSFRAEQEFQEFTAGNSKCTIVNKDDAFRISYDSKTDFISYDFM